VVENDRNLLSAKSSLGRAMMLQALSAIFIIGGLLLFWTPAGFLDLESLTVGALYATGFVQIILVRYILQREVNGVLGSLIVSVAAMLFTFIATIIQIGQSGQEWIALYFALTMLLNFVLAYMLRNILLLMAKNI
jgi:hypothetical protein